MYRISGYIERNKKETEEIISKLYDKYKKKKGFWGDGRDIMQIFNGKCVLITPTIHLIYMFTINLL